ncbi:hypothetical protein [Pedobacter sp. SL55]|uniref:hypothetical protein n=1 Tax=Pedobacter sp. SL55 TaxID=2995161 RepID=UPI0022702550|nr:hypothetical protein [Pedobacter sp. SL55]WAC41097.1 hypothetical protein OVA16_01600 [Pedobacter sp. SL55]
MDQIVEKILNELNEFALSKGKICFPIEPVFKTIAENCIKDAAGLTNSLTIIESIEDLYDDWVNQCIIYVSQCKTELLQNDSHYLVDIFKIPYDDLLGKVIYLEKQFNDAQQD